MMMLRDEAFVSICRLHIHPRRERVNDTLLLSDQIPLSALRTKEPTKTARKNGRCNSSDFAVFKKIPHPLSTHSVLSSHLQRFPS